MTYVLPFDLVELVPGPAMGPVVPTSPLREIPFRRDAWLPEEIASLRAGFTADVDLQAIADELGRTLAAVRTKIGELGLRRNSSRPWSEMEDSFLAQNYGLIATSGIACDFGRAPAAIYARAGLLKLTEGNPPPYTEWEIAQLRAGYEQGVPVSQLGVLIGRPVTGIASLASKLGIAHANSPHDWSAEEQQRALVLAEAGHRYRHIAAELLAEGFPERQHNAVGRVLRKLGYGRGWGRTWLPEEDDLLRCAYATGAKLTPLRERLGRTPNSIRYRAGELGLQGTHARPNGWRTEPSWTDEEIAVLRRDYGKVSTHALAAALGRKKGGVYNKAFSLGLVHGWMRAFSEEEERAIRIARAGSISLPDLGQALGRDPAVVSKHATRMGIPFATRPHKAPRGPRRHRRPLDLAAILALDVPLTSGQVEELPKPSRLPTTLTDDPAPALTRVTLPGVLPMKADMLAAMQTAGLLVLVAQSAGVILLAPRVT